jgi:hypothetical protein
VLAVARAARARRPIITLVVQMNQDGTPVKAELKDPGRYNSDPAIALRPTLLIARS